MAEYKIITRADDPELIDFINYVFSYSDEPTDFIQLLPKAYSGEVCHEVIHLTVLEEGKIRAAVSVLIFSLVQHNQQLKVGFVGNVAVHPYSRRKGYMKELMKRAETVMREKGCDLAALSGQRQRYEYFGYYQACPQAVFSVSQTNLRHTLKGGANSLSCREAGGGETKTIRELYELYRKGAVSGRTETDFEADCRSWGSRLISIQNGEKIVGYAVAGADYGSWSEASVPPGQYAQALEAFMKTFAVRRMRLEVPLYDQGALDELESFSGMLSLQNSCMLRILRWERVLSWALTLGEAAEGTGELNVDGAGAYQIAIQNGEVRVKQKQAAQSEPLSEKEAMRLMFSPLPLRQRAGYPRNWFPLKLWIPQADMF